MVVVEILILNTLIAAALALLAKWVGHFGRAPLSHALYVCAVLKLLTPSFIPLEILPTESQQIHQVSPIQSHSLESRTPIALNLTESESSAETGPAWDPSFGDDQVLGPKIQLVPTDDLGSVPPVQFPNNGSLRWLFGAWILGSAFVSGLLICRFRLAMRICEHALPIPSWLSKELSRTRRQIGLSGDPELLLIKAFISPMVVSWFSRPRLLLPFDLLSSLDSSQRRTLMAHELAHIKRRDHWIRHLEALAMVVLWWHPLLWWIKKRLHEQEEACCDAWVVSLGPNHKRTYARALLDTIDYLHNAQSVAPPFSSAFGPLSHNKRRLTMILDGKVRRSLTPWWRGAMIALTGILFPWMPIQAQDPAVSVQAMPLPGDPAAVAHVETSEEADDIRLKDLSKRELINIIRELHSRGGWKPAPAREGNPVAGVDAGYARSRSNEAYSELATATGPIVSGQGDQGSRGQGRWGGGVRFSDSPVASLNSQEGVLPTSRSRAGGDLFGRSGDTTDSSPAPVAGGRRPTGHSSADSQERMDRLEEYCRDLKSQINQIEAEIKELKSQTIRPDSKVRRGLIR